MEKFILSIIYYHPHQSYFFFNFTAGHFKVFSKLQDLLTSPFFDFMKYPDTMMYTGTQGCVSL